MNHDPVAEAKLPPHLRHSDELSPAKLRAKITHFLSVYPYLSPTHLQCNLANTPTHRWRPVLIAMVEEGVVKQKELTKDTPAGRTVTNTILWLSSRPDYNHELNT